MTFRLLRLIAPALAIVALGAPAQADTIVLAQWTFETSIPTTAGPHVAEEGILAATSVATASHASANTVYSNPVGNGSMESFSSNNWTEGDYYQFATSTLGYTDGIEIYWDQTRSGTGPALFRLSYSTDGSTFVAIDDYEIAQITWSSNPDNFSPDSRFTYDLSTIEALNDQANVFFRLTSLVTTAAAGTNRVDNFTISAVPEPGSIALVGMGVFGLIGVGLRRRMRAERA